MRHEPGWARPRFGKFECRPGRALRVTASHTATADPPVLELRGTHRATPVCTPASPVGSPRVTSRIRPNRVVDSNGRRIRDRLHRPALRRRHTSVREPKCAEPTTRESIACRFLSRTHLPPRVSPMLTESVSARSCFLRRTVFRRACRPQRALGDSSLPHTRHSCVRLQPSAPSSSDRRRTPNAPGLP